MKELSYGVFHLEQIHLAWKMGYCIYGAGAVLYQTLSGIEIAIQSNWADLRRLPKPPKTLLPRIISSLELYPCDLLFVHRDAEKEPHKKRVLEIKEAISQAVKSVQVPPVVCVVPVRMQEAWLLFDEAALRQAAGNPNGRQPLELPDLAKLEQLPDPKNILHELLRTASGLSPGRLPAFMSLESEIEQLIESQGWCSE